MSSMPRLHQTCLVLHVDDLPTCTGTGAPPQGTARTRTSAAGRAAGARAAPPQQPTAGSWAPPAPNRQSSPWPASKGSLWSHKRGVSSQAARVSSTAPSQASKVLVSLWYVDAELMRITAISDTHLCAFNDRSQKANSPTLGVPHQSGDATRPPAQRPPRAGPRPCWQYVPTLSTPPGVI